MKAILRIFVLGSLLLFLVFVAAYFVLTNAGFQKRLLEGKLPEGSSVRHVRITPNSLDLSELILVMQDGTRLQIEAINTSFSLKEALFDRTIRTGLLKVDGLLVQLPERVTAGSYVPSTSGAKKSTEVSNVLEQSSEAVAPTNPWDSISAITELEWLFDIDSVKLNGKLLDGSGSTYAFDVAAGAIRPDLETVLDASVVLVSSSPIQSAMSELTADATIRFKQKANGGFKPLSIQSDIQGVDEQGRDVLVVSNETELSFDGFEETASLSINFDASLQQPESFIPELEGAGAVQIQGSLSAQIDGMVTTLSNADLRLNVQGVDVLSVELKKTLNIGGKQDLRGELLAIQIDQLPLEWVAPWLPDQMTVSGTPLSTSILVSGLDDGAMEVTTVAPIRLGFVSVQTSSQVYLDNATLVIDPMIRINADQSIEYDFKSIRLLDKYGEVLNASISGRSSQVESSSKTYAGEHVEVDMNVRLLELSQQPLLRDQVSVLGGTLALAVKIDLGHEYPLIAQGTIKGLRPRSSPGSIKDVRFAAQLKALSADTWGLGLNFEAGSEERPSTSIYLSGQSQMAADPLKFKLNVNGSKLSQKDIDLLVAVFSPKKSAVGLSTLRSDGTHSKAGTIASTELDVTGPPPWAGLKGDAFVNLDQYLLSSGQAIENIGLKVAVSEALLDIYQLNARAGEGTLTGLASIQYDSSQSDAYTLSAEAAFKQVNPAIFSKNRSASFPLTGLFDGEFKLDGAGVSLEDSLDNSVGDLRLTGRDGLLTAFELDHRKQIGLGLVGIIGQRLDRPGIAALSHTIPYFKDIYFDHFVLDLKRGEDRRVIVPQLRFEGESLLIDGSGVIAASKLSELMNQPLQLSLELGAKGRLTHSLETLQLLQSAVSEDGYRRWNKAVKIGGTLNDPNTNGIMDLLKSAANQAISNPKRLTPTELSLDLDQANQAQPAKSSPVEPKKTKQEEIIHDVELGLELLNSVFGK